MKALALLFVLLAQTAMADTFSYQLYYDQEKTEVLDIKVEVVLSGKFTKTSKVQAVKIYGNKKNKNVLLFNFPANLIKASWKGNVLNVATVTMKPEIKGEYIAIHSDTNINEGEEYGLSMVINENGSLATDVEGLDLSNHTVEEMGLAGFLKKL